MRKQWKWYGRLFVAGLACVTMAACGSGQTDDSADSGEEAEEASGEQAIKDVHSVGFVDADGSKLSAIIVEYDQPIAADSVTEDSFEVEDYGLLNNPECELGENPGAVTKVYVNDEAAVAENPTAENGNYVVIEVNTDYQLAAVPSYEGSVIAGVKQVAELTNADGETIPAGEDFVRNYTETEEEMDMGGKTRTIVSYEVPEDSYTIQGIEGYELHWLEDDTAFHATGCFEEATGESVDVDLPYAIFVPEDYHEDGKYALVLHIHDAGFMGNDPMITLTEAQGPANFASDEVQAIAKEQGLDGIIVVCPQYDMSIRTTRDNYTTSAGVAAAWQLMDSITDEYSVDMNHIYGTGQSMGGMQVIEMAVQRDNYFAALWELGCQWGNNYDKDEPYNDQSYYSSDDPTIWTEDADGKDSDFGRNWYYLISDDNVLSTNCNGDAFSTNVWNEIKYLYQDIAGVEIPYTAFSPLEISVEEQDAKLEEFLAQENPLGIYWQAYDGGSHMLTWVYGHKMDAGYRWLLSQNRQSEMERGKLEALNAEWKAETDEAKIAEKQTDERSFYEDEDGTKYYYAVPAENAGTIGYNAAWFGPTGSFEKLPGWVKGE